MTRSSSRPVSQERLYISVMSLSVTVLSTCHCVTYDSTLTCGPETARAARPIEYPFSDSMRFSTDATDTLALPMSVIWLFRTPEDGMSPCATTDILPGPRDSAMASVVRVVPISSAAIGSDRFILYSAFVGSSA